MNKKIIRTRNEYYYRPPLMSIAEVQKYLYLNSFVEGFDVIDYCEYELYFLKNEPEVYKSMFEYFEQNAEYWILFFEYIIANLKNGANIILEPIPSVIANIDSHIFVNTARKPLREI